MKILVTGASGFVGQNLVKRLISDGHEVIATSMGGENRIPDGVSKVLHYSLEGIDWASVGGADIVFHLAANANTLCLDDREMLRANLYGPIKLFTNVAQTCKKIVYASSTAVYGDSPIPYVEDKTPTNPLNIYGKSKLMFDHFAMEYVEEVNKRRAEFNEQYKDHPNMIMKDPITIVGLRYCNIYGPCEKHKGQMMSTVGQMLQTMRRGCKFTLFEDGEQKRDWVYVKDVVEANILAMNYEGKSDIFNIGTGQAVSFNNVAEIISDLLLDQDRKLKPNYKPCPFEDRYQNHTECSIEKARTQLGFSPKYDLRTGLKDYMES